MDDVISLEDARKNKTKKEKTKKQDQVAIKAKQMFEQVMLSGNKLSDDDFRDYVMLVFADLAVYILNANYYENTPVALKRGIDILNREYGPNAQR